MEFNLSNFFQFLLFFDSHFEELFLRFENEHFYSDIPTQF